MTHFRNGVLVTVPFVLASLSLSIGLIAQDRATTIDLTKPSVGLTNDTARIVLHGVPAEEAKAKNELNLRSPALLVGPEMPGVGRPRLCRWRHEMLDQHVQVEGVALGTPPQQPSHMTGQRVIYEGGMIFIKGVDFLKTGAAGKLVRISGTLQLEPESVMEFDGHEPITVDKYYYIQADKLDLVERVTEPFLVAPKLHR